MGFLESAFSAATGGTASFGSSRDAILGHGGEDSVALISKREVSEPCILKCCMLNGFAFTHWPLCSAETAADEGQVSYPTVSHALLGLPHLPTYLATASRR